MRIYMSEWGAFEIPIGIWAKSFRFRDSDPDYLNKWCEWQYKKALYQL